MQDYLIYLMNLSVTISIKDKNMINISLRVNKVSPSIIWTNFGLPPVFLKFPLKTIKFFGFHSQVI